MRPTLLITGFLAVSCGAIPLEAAPLSPTAGVAAGMEGIAKISLIKSESRPGEAAERPASGYVIGNFEFSEEDNGDVTGDKDPAGGFSKMREPDFCDLPDGVTHSTAGDPQFLPVTSLQSVPEPSSMAVFGLGLLVFAVLCRARRFISPLRWMSASA